MKVTGINDILERNNMDNELNYYEIELGYLKDGADEIDYESPYTICIASVYFPDNKDILDLCTNKLGKDYDYVHSITGISEEEQQEYWEDVTYRILTAEE